MVEHEISLCGGVVYFSLGEWSSYETLDIELNLLGLGKYAPGKRGPAAALKDALVDTFPKHRVERLEKQDAYEVVKIDRGEYANSYNQVLRATMLEDNRIRFSPLDERAQAVTESFNKHLGLVRGAQVSSCVVDIIASLGGTSLRPKGAIYWIPQDSLLMWRCVSRVIESAGANKMYTLSIRMDQEAVKAVQDAIVAEVMSSALAMEREIQEQELGNRALEHRQQQAELLRTKIKEYEDILGIGLNQLHQAVDSAERAATAAMLLSTEAA